MDEAQRRSAEDLKRAQLDRQREVTYLNSALTELRHEKVELEAALHTARQLDTQTLLQGVIQTQQAEITALHQQLAQLQAHTMRITAENEDMRMAAAARSAVTAAPASAPVPAAASAM